MTNSGTAQNKPDLLKLERLLGFASGRPITNETVSYQTTVPTKHLLQAGMVQETKITNGTKTTTTRFQTDEEKLDDLRKILAFGGL